MAQINWHQVNAHLVNALHAMQTGWGKARDYVTRVEEPEWESDPNWSPTMPTAAQAQKAQAFWDAVMEGVEAGLENREDNNDNEKYWEELTESHIPYNIRHGADPYHVSQPFDAYDGWIR